MNEPHQVEMGPDYHRAPWVEFEATMALKSKRKKQKLEQLCQENKSKHHGDGTRLYPKDNNSNKDIQEEVKEVVFGRCLKKCTICKMDPCWWTMGGTPCIVNSINDKYENKHPAEKVKYARDFYTRWIKMTYNKKKWDVPKPFVLFECVEEGILKTWEDELILFQN